MGPASWAFCPERKGADTSVCSAQPTPLCRALPQGVGAWLRWFEDLIRMSRSPKCSNDAVLVATFHPTDPSIIITCGKSHIYFWSLEGGSLSKRQGLFEVSGVGVGEDRLGLREAGRDTQADSRVLHRVPAVTAGASVSLSAPWG